MKWVNLNSTIIVRQIVSLLFAACAAVLTTNHANAKEATAAPTPQTQALQKFSEAGNAAIRAIHGARFAIFNAEPQAAMKLLTSAQSLLSQAAAEAPTYAVTTETIVGGKIVGTTTKDSAVLRVPVDAQLLFADMVETQQGRQTHIDDANKHFGAGDRVGALKELQQAGVDVNYSESWLPIATSRQRLDQAIKFARDGKYYQAMLALKAIEDSVSTDSVRLSNWPATLDKQAE